MQHSIAAKYAARPAAHFVRTSTLGRERRLGLRPVIAFVAAPARRTVLRTPDLGPLAALRAPWRAIRPAPARPRRSGRIGPVAVFHWTGGARPGGSRPAPQRRRGATEAGHRHLRRRHRHPESGGPARVRRGPAAARPRRHDLDAAQGNAPRR